MNMLYLKVMKNINEFSINFSYCFIQESIWTSYSEVDGCNFKCSVQKDLDDCTSSCTPIGDQTLRLKDEDSTALN